MSTITATNVLKRATFHETSSEIQEETGSDKKIKTLAQNNFTEEYVGIEDSENWMKGISSAIDYIVVLDHCRQTQSRASKIELIAQDWMLKAGAQLRVVFEDKSVFSILQKHCSSLKLNTAQFNKILEASLIQLTYKHLYFSLAGFENGLCNRIVGEEMPGAYKISVLKRLSELELPVIPASEKFLLLTQFEEMFSMSPPVKKASPLREAYIKKLTSVFCKGLGFHPHPDVSLLPISQNQRDLELAYQLASLENNLSFLYNQRFGKSGNKNC